MTPEQNGTVEKAPQPPPIKDNNKLKKEEKKDEDLSEEDLALKQQLELYVERVQELSLESMSEAKKLAVLVETGSFNPPTFMHLHMFEAARETLLMHGYHVVGGYMSPVNSAYGKKGLAPADHRIKMCQLAAEGSSLIMVDAWEALQPTYQRTLKVLTRLRDALQDVSTKLGPIQVMLLCGADLLESLTVPGIWFPDQVEIICRDYGLVCVQRGGRDWRKLIQECDLLSKYHENIITVDHFESDISSSSVRENLGKGLPVDRLTPAKVIDYIRLNNLYSANGP